MKENLHVADVVNFKLFSQEKCQEIISLYENSSDWIQTKVGRDSEIVTDSEIRRSSIISLSENHDFILKYLSDMSDAIREANSQFWNFNITERMEIQIMKYVSGDHYSGWHMDIGNTPTAASRKISFIIQLSDPELYDGGNLIIESMDQGHGVRLQGSATMFPSFISHRVSEVVSGFRYCLVGWVHGPTFK
tara:strand:- start:14855 stop:15427 length:573 start_codon:yes stop_codon:yes gene_type:complete